MTPQEAVQTAQLMLSDYEHCVYDRHAWAAVVRALLPSVEAALAYHTLIHQHVCGNPLPLNFTQIDERRLWQLLETLCSAASKDVA